MKIKKNRHFFCNNFIIISVGGILFITSMLIFLFSYNARAGIQDDLSAYWMLDEGSGLIAADNTGNGNTGTLVNGTSWVSGHAGNAVYFDGVDDYIDLGTSDFGINSSNEFTISLWANPAVNVAGTDVLIRRGHYIYPFSLHLIDGNRVRAGVRTSGTNYLNSNTVLELNNWTHIAYTFQSGSRIIYINGQLDNSDAVSGTLSSKSGSAHIGHTPDDAEYFNGAIDELRIYNRALTAEEVSILATGAVIEPVCGDGVAEGTEECDDDAANSDTAPSCDYGPCYYCTTSCTAAAAQGVRYCGDNTVDTDYGEVCDGSALNGETCESQGFDTGTLACNADCAAYDISSCDITPDDNQKMNLPDPVPLKEPRFELTGKIWPSNYGQAHICLWEDDKVASASLTIDDNLAHEHDWWLEQMERLNWKLTWFVIVDRLELEDNIPVMGTWDVFRNLFAMGHDVQSHTLTHGHCADGCPQEDLYTCCDYDVEYGTSQAIIRERMPGNPALAIAYNGGHNYDHDPYAAAKYYIAGRWTTGAPNRANGTWYMYTNSVCPLYTATIDSILNPNTNHYYRGWMSVHFHSINNYGADVLASRLDYLKSKEDDIWVGLWLDVAKYGQERDTSRLTVTSVSEDDIRFNLADEMYDAYFTYPLTVKVRLNSDWNEISATQNGLPIDSKIIEHEGNKYALVKATPDKGGVILQKGGVVNCLIDADCDDSLFCNGQEICNAGVCGEGTPLVFDDGLDCTIDSCDEASDQILHTPDNTLCDDGIFCNGAEICNGNACESGIPPTLDDGINCTIDLCDEINDQIVHAPDNTYCDDGIFCNGAEICGVAGCEAGPFGEDDGVACTIDSCSEATQEVSHIPDNTYCDDELFCSGVETCNALLGCQTETAPTIDDSIACTIDACNEADDIITHVPDDDYCYDIRPFGCNTAICDIINDCQFSDCTVPDDLKLWYKLDDFFGNITSDSSGNGHTGALTNGPEWVFGHSNGAVSFDGIDDYINAGQSALDIDLDSELTLSMWINIQGPGANKYKTLLQRGQYVYPFWLYLTGTSDGNMRIGSSIRTSRTNYLYSTQRLNWNTWYHIAVTYRDGERIIYINGNSDASDSPTGTLNISTYAQTISVGDSASAAQGFEGIIDEVKIYNRALTANEINDIYNN